MFLLPFFYGKQKMKPEFASACLPGVLLFLAGLVTAGDSDPQRPRAERVLGIPPGQVIGSIIRTKFEMRDAGPVLMRLPGINFIDDKALDETPENGWTEVDMKQDRKAIYPPANNH